MGYSRGQRKTLYVSRSIQGVVMGRFALYWIGYHFTLWHAMLLYGYIRGNLLTAFTGGGMSFWEYYMAFFQANNTILIAAAAICPIMLWDTLRVTHRIAGPIVRFKDVLKRLSRGEHVEKVQLREKDLMDDLRDAFNEFLATRKKPIETQEISSQDLHNMLENVAANDEEHEAEENTEVATSV